MMECNKEEAIRAKGLAEKKMEMKDFIGARKVALKAQRLFPDLENICQMLMVCDVHCSAEHRIFGKEMDWYGILQIDPTVDEAAIKKQYRKFAFLLHPDKNKFTGAEAAFKLIGEAQRLLLGKGKRSLHDVMRTSSVTSRPTVPFRPPQKGSSNTSFGVQNNYKMKTSFIPQHQRAQLQPQPGFTTVQPTFWTACLFCEVKYKYYKEISGKYIRCPNCSNFFKAQEINIEGVPLSLNRSMPTFSQQRDVPNQVKSKVEVEFQETSNNQNVKRESFPRTRFTSGVGAEKVKENRKGKQDIESSESFDPRSSSISTKEDEDHDLCSKRKSEFSGDQDVGRSFRHKQQVSYKENLCDDDQVSHPKRAKEKGSNYATGAETEDTSNKEEAKMNMQAGASAKVKEDNNAGAFVKESLPNCYKETKQVSGNRIEEENDSEQGAEVDIDLESNPDVEVYQYPYPDFNDFDNIRKEGCFKCGQTWAIYDTVDAMPRFYAHIRKVLSPGFKLRITWLKPVPNDEIGIKWVNKDLPISCGKFRKGNSEITKDRLIFSHLVSCVRGSQRNSYKIYPRKGETWALFKNWSTSWATDPNGNGKYDYEYVEILSEYVEDIGLTVAYLGKVKGFVSLFCRMEKEETGKSEIPPSEFCRFSHKVPSYQMSGEEREGVPKGSYELDPGSLPTTIEAIDASVSLEVGAGNGHLNDSCSRSHVGKVNPMTGCEGSASRSQNGVKVTRLDSKDSNLVNVIEDCCSPVPSSQEDIELPNPEFYNFDADKSPDKFLVGQFWALYSDEDGLPRYYGKVTKVDNSPNFKLHITWLNADRLLPKGITKREHKDILFGCGIFKVKLDASQAYTSTSSFSHQLKVQHTVKKNEYAIFPSEHEVWALYKNWNDDIRCSDLDNCEYEIVEILEDNDCRITVLVLECVSGFRSVFKAQVHGESAVTLEIARTELLRFSHQIPAFRLMCERGGKLRGCWELDPAALPLSFFSK